MSPSWSASLDADPLLLSLDAPAPPGFAHDPGPRFGLLRRRVYALHAPALAPVLALFPGLEQSTGVVVTPGAAWSHRKLSATCGHIEYPGARAGELAACLAPLLAALAGRRREQDEIARLELELQRTLLDRKQVSADQAALRDSLVREIAERREAEQTAHDYADELAEVNTDLRQANESLRQLDRQKSEFLAAVSHEIRTPLAIMMGTLESLQHASTDADPALQRTILGILNRNAVRLSRLIDNLLDIARIDAHRFTVYPARIDLRQSVASAIEMFSFQFQKSGVVLRYTPPPAPMPADADPDKIIQVLCNLLDNALRHARTLIAVELAEEPGAVRLSVLDDGPGVNDQELPQLFQRFSRLEPSGDKSHIGLGLSIVKAIAEAHGGRAEAGNVQQPFPGTRFSLFLPLASPDA